MAFNPDAYKPAEPKSLPVVLLLDVSGSMYGNKIKSLHDSVVEMVQTFVQERVKETSIKLSIITFGNRVELQAPSTNDEPYVDILDVENKGIPMFNADGWTPLGCALTMAKDMIEDKNVTPGKWYAPAVVLVSDGQPNDEWKAPLKKFITEGRTARCQRIAVAIGNDADRDVLKTFTGDANMVFFADGASQIASAFKKVTLSISQRATQSNPDANLPHVPGSFDATNGPAQARPSQARPSQARPSQARPAAPSQPIDDEDDF